VQQGLHQELLAVEGTYRRLWERQQAAQQLQSTVALPQS
jgi:ATP-binding cassette subfamily B protein